MAKKQKSKKNNETKTNKNVLTDTDIETIKSQTNEIISKLEQERKSVFKSKTNKELIDHQIADLKRFLDEEQYYLLKDKINALKKLEEEEKKKLEEKQEKQKREKWNFNKFVQSVQEFDRWPLYSRIKRINNNYEGNDKTKRLALLIGAFVVLIIVMVIGILLISNAIPYHISQDTTKVGPWMIFVIPLALLFFL